MAATRRVSATLQKLPREITPVNLEELRRVKQVRGLGHCLQGCLEQGVGVFGVAAWCAVVEQWLGSLAEVALHLWGPRWRRCLCHGAAVPGLPPEAVRAGLGWEQGWDLCCCRLSASMPHTTDFLQMLVELESKAENLRDLLEELMDDEDDLGELNLSSRPKRGEAPRVHGCLAAGWCGEGGREGGREGREAKRRLGRMKPHDPLFTHPFLPTEEKRKQRERERLEREIEKESGPRSSPSSSSSSDGGWGAASTDGGWVAPSSPLPSALSNGTGAVETASAPLPRVAPSVSPPMFASTLELREPGLEPLAGTAPAVAPSPSASSSSSNGIGAGAAIAAGPARLRSGSGRAERLAQLRGERSKGEDRDRDEDDSYQDAQDALEEMMEEVGD